MKRIGIIGGGQLGMLLAMSLQKLEAEVLIYDPDPEAPACRIAKSINADWTDTKALAQFLSQCDRATYEFENVSYESLAALNHRTPIIPSIDVLRITQNRANEKKFLRSNNLPHVPYISADNLPELLTKIGQLQFPIIIKSTTGGYDGKSQVYLKTEFEFKAAFSDLNNNSLPPFPLVAEQAIDLHMEVSCITACSLDRHKVIFPVFENVHHNHILDTTTVPANIPDEISSVIQTIAQEAADKLGVLGLLCTEFFLSQNSESTKSAYSVGQFNLYINEFAPRPHNSGHITMSSCDFSQFDVLARILLDLPIRSPILVDSHYFCMANLLGDIWLAQGTPQGNKLNLAGLDNDCDSLQFFLYGKTEARSGRKMGHLISKAKTPYLAKESAIKTRQQLMTASCLK